MFKEKFIQLNVYKEKSSQINNLIFHLKKLEKDEETKLKPRRKKLIKIWAEISETESRKPREDP